MKTDPQYTRRDGVYFYLAETYNKTRKPDEALPLYQKVLEEFQESQYLKMSKRRIDELTALNSAPAATGANTVTATPTAAPPAK